MSNYKFTRTEDELIAEIDTLKAEIKRLREHNKELAASYRHVTFHLATFHCDDENCCCEACRAYRRLNEVAQ